MMSGSPSTPAKTPAEILRERVAIPRALTRNPLPAKPSPLRESSPAGMATEQKSGESSTQATQVGESGENDNAIVSGMKAINVTPPDSSAGSPMVVDSASAKRPIPTGPRATGAMSSFSHSGAAFSSNNWRGGDTFVQSGKNDEADDPFVSPTLNIKQPIHQTPPTDTRITPIQPTPRPTSLQAGGDFVPRMDRFRHEMSPVVAQGVFSPHACIFVANLSKDRSDGQLDEAVKYHFGRFGRCYVKIRRDKVNMPFAFVQYETPEDARVAIRSGKGLWIDGRSVRTEQAKVNRSVFLTRITGGPISEAEAREVLQAFGSIESVFHIPPPEQEFYQLPEGCWVKFAYFQDCRDAQNSFRNDDKYRLEQPPTPESLRQQATYSPAQYEQAPPAVYHERHVFPPHVPDRNSVFAGNLPPTINRQQLTQLFCHYGRILTVDIVQKPGTRGTTFSTFAFVGFQTLREADQALAADINIDGYRVRVERKEGTLRRQIRQGLIPGTVPPYNQVLATLYNQALELGLPHQQAAEILSVGQPKPIANMPHSFNTPSPGHSYQQQLAAAQQQASYQGSSTVTALGSPIAGPMTYNLPELPEQIHSPGWQPMGQFTYAPATHNTALYPLPQEPYVQDWAASSEEHELPVIPEDDDSDKENVAPAELQ